MWIGHYAHVLCRPGSDLLSRVLRRSTIGAEEFNGRVRDGIGFRLLAIATRPAKHMGIRCCEQRAKLVFEEGVIWLCMSG